jgi:NAD(P)-dependent dehydrogenase (short-subunit alcohol dehydrogenase family)
MQKIALITGASNGIGLITAIEVAKAGFKTVIAGRNKKKTIESVEIIKNKSGNNDIDYLIADLSIIAESKKLAEDFKNKYDRLDLLVNNAGAVIPELRITKDGLENTFALNHFSYFIITGLLLDLLKKAEKSRIVNVSSGAHQASVFKFENIKGEIEYKSFPVYCQSKLANVLFTYELARKLKGSSVTVNCLHPGVVKTGFGTDYKGFIGLLMKIYSPFLLTPEKGSQTSVYLSLDKEVEGVSGKYFYKKKSIKSSPASYDEILAKKLWEISQEITGINY